MIDLERWEVFWCYNHWDILFDRLSIDSFVAFSDIIPGSGSLTSVSVIMVQAEVKAPGMVYLKESRSVSTPPCPGDTAGLHQ
jgi:hypothetical protein